MHYKRESSWGHFRLEHDIRVYTLSMGATLMAGSLPLWRTGILNLGLFNPQTQVDAFGRTETDTCII